MGRRDPLKLRSFLGTMVGNLTNTFSSRSEIARSCRTKLSVRLFVLSNVVKEIKVLGPFTPNCLIRASVQNEEELPLSKKA